MRSRLCRRRSNSSTPGRVGMLLGCALVALSSCRLTPTRVTSCPLTFEQQSAEIVSIAPLGTPRAEAVERLADAGIRGNFAHLSNSIYYCDLWERPEGARWHTQVALLFDDEGLLYATRPADSAVTTGQAHTASANADGERVMISGNTDGRGEARHSATARESATPPAGAEEAEPRPSSVRTGARTPVGAL